MKIKVFVLTMLLFSPTADAANSIIDKEINNELEMLESDLGVKELSKRPLKIQLVTPAKQVRKDIGRGPTEPLPAVTVGQDIDEIKNLTTLSGKVSFENIEKDKNFSSLWNSQSHLEIYFFNSVSPSGVPHSSSLELVPPLILPAGEKNFNLKAPIGSEGYLVAYIYYSEAGRSDIAIFSEEIIGVSPEKILVSKDGIKELEISIYKIKTLQEQHPFVSLSGWVHDEYHQHLGLAQSTISVVGTTIAVITDKFGRYTIPKLPKFSRIVLQIDRAGYVTTRIPIELRDSDFEFDIFVSPESKFLRAITSSISNWNSRRYGLIEGKIVNGKNGLTVRISSSAEGIIYLDNAGLPINYITKKEWERGKFEKGTVSSGDFIVVNVEKGFLWLEIWDGANKIIREPINVEEGMVNKVIIDLSKAHGFAGRVKSEDYSAASNLTVQSLSVEGSVDIQPVGFIQKEKEKTDGLWIENNNMGEFIFPDFSIGTGRTIFELKKEDYITTISSSKVGTTPTLLMFPEKYVSKLVTTANRQIKKINGSNYQKLQFFPEILKGTGAVVVDVPSMPSKTAIECFGSQGTLAYFGDKGLIDIYSTSTTPEGDGRFMLYNLVPGEYTIAGYLEDSLVFLDTVIVLNGSITFIGQTI